MIHTDLLFCAVDMYNIERGFGYASQKFPNETSRRIFFHITTIKKANPDLATHLDRGGSPETVFFWCKTETTPKGFQVGEVWPQEKTDAWAVSRLDFLMQRIESFWEDPHGESPDWLPHLTSQLLDLSPRNSRIRELIEARTAAGIAADAERQRLREEELAMEEAKEREFLELVSEIAPLGFTHSSQLSRYIVKNQLGYKYKNISGILEMTLNGNTWKFPGGFPKEIYAKLCRELSLENNKTKARAGKFESFGDLEKKRRHP